jgi:hypothetical protein
MEMSPNRIGILSIYLLLDKVLRTSDQTHKKGKKFDTYLELQIRKSAPRQTDVYLP